MTHIILDDKFFEHPKAIAAGRDGRDMYIAALCYCGSNLTDGFIPEGALPLIAARCGVSKIKQATDANLAAGLWMETDGGFCIHHYLEWQTSSEKVQANRAAARERMQRLRSPEVRANNQRSSPEVREPTTPTTTTTRIPPKSPRTGGTNPPRRIDPEWTVDDGLRSWAHDRGFSDSEIDHHGERFRNYWIAAVKNATSPDWPAKFRTWLGKETPGKWPGAAPPRSTEQPRFQLPPQWDWNDVHEWRARKAIGAFISPEKEQLLEQIDAYNRGQSAEQSGDGTGRTGLAAD